MYLHDVGANAVDDKLEIASVCLGVLTVGSGKIMDKVVPRIKRKYRTVVCRHAIERCQFGGGIVGQFATDSGLVFCELHSVDKTSVELIVVGKIIQHPTFFRGCQSGLGIAQKLLHAFGSGLGKLVFLIFQAGLEKHKWKC